MLRTQQIPRRPFLFGEAIQFQQSLSLIRTISMSHPTAPFAALSQHALQYRSIIYIMTLVFRSRCYRQPALNYDKLPMWRAHSSAYFKTLAKAEAQIRAFGDTIFGDAIRRVHRTFVGGGGGGFVGKFYGKGMKCVSIKDTLSVSKFFYIFFCDNLIHGGRITLEAP